MKNLPTMVGPVRVRKDTDLKSLLRISRLPRFPSVILLLLALLAATDYEGWMVIEAEQDPEKAPPAVYMEKALEYLAEIAGLGG